MDKVSQIPIIEIFGPTIQGEGAMTGTVSHFIRTGGCGLRCSWCDSMHAVLPAEIKRNRTMMTIPEIHEAVTHRLKYAPWITLTGGDPCLHKTLGELIMMFNAQGQRVAVETQGELFPAWLADCDVITFSPKGPSSGNVVDASLLVIWLVEHWHKFKGHACIKVVCFDEADFQYAMQVYRATETVIGYGSRHSFYFTAGTRLNMDSPFSRTVAVLDKLQWLSNRILQEASETGVQFAEYVHVGCQAHVLLWPDKDKGV